MTAEATTTNLPARRTAENSPLVAMGFRLHLDPKALHNCLRNTIMRPPKNARPATDEELTVFCMIANKYDLDPFLREIHALVAKNGGIVPYVGIDGWVKLVTRDGRYRGCEFEELHDPDGNLVATTCTMHVAGLEVPTRVTEWFHECYKDTDPWNRMKHRMLRHKSYMQAARVAFGISGIYDEDEARDAAGLPVVEHQPSAPPPPATLPMGPQSRRGALAPSAPAEYGPPPPPDAPVPPPGTEPDWDPAQGQQAEGVDAAGLEADESVRVQLVQDAEEAIAEATTVAQLHPVKMTLTTHKKFLGEQFSRLWALREEKFREITDSHEGV